MDERDAMGGYYLHRGLGVAPGSIQQGVLHGPQSIRGIPNQNPNFGAQSHQIGGGGGSIGQGFQSESSSSANMLGSSFTGHEEPEKKKRGRPRKYGLDGALALSPLPGSVGVVGSGSGASASGSGSGMAKRGRGRPPGSGKKQQLASHGEWIAGSAGTGFTPHIITIAVGEDIGNKIMSFSQQGPRTVCILSANGAVSTVTLRQNGNYGGTVTYEGRFDIICLSGAYIPSDGGSHSRSGGLSISLSKPDGRVFGGDVGGALIAATQVQVIIGSFLRSGSKSKNKSKSEQESSGNDGHEHHQMGGDRQNTPPMRTAPTQSITAQMMGGGWQVPRNNNALDIDLTRG